MVSQRKVGAALSLAATCTNAVLTLVYVPVLLLFLSNSEYGVYELIGSLIGYMSILDLGFSTTLVRFCVEQRRRGEKEESNLLAIAAVVYGCITVIAVIIGLLVNNVIDSVFSGGFNDAELSLTHQLMLLVIANCAIVLPGNYFLAFVNSHERFIFSRILLLSRYVLQFVGTVSFLLFGLAAVGAVAAQVIANAITTVISVWFCVYRLKLRPRFYKWDFKLVKDLVSFSIFVLLGLIFNQVFLKTGQVILGAVSGTLQVGIYALGCKIVAFYIQVANSVSTVFLPRLTELQASKASLEINRIFLLVGRVQSILVWGILAGFIALGKDFTLLWAGSEYIDMYWVTIILMLGFSIDLVQNLGIMLLQACNKLAFRCAVLTVVSIVDIALSIIVAPTYGPAGCAFVTAVLVFVATGPIMNVYYARVMGIRIAYFWRKVLPQALVSIACCLICLWLFPMLFIDVTWLILVEKALLFGIVYALLTLPFVPKRYLGIRHRNASQAND